MWIRASACSGTETPETSTCSGETPCSSPNWVPLHPSHDTITIEPTAKVSVAGVCAVQVTVKESAVTLAPGRSTRRSLAPATKSCVWQTPAGKTQPCADVPRFPSKENETTSTVGAGGATGAIELDDGPLAP